MIGVLIAVGVGVASFAALRATARTPCEALSEEVCDLGQMIDCTPARERFKHVEAVWCRSTLDEIGSTSDHAKKLTIATQAMNSLVPDVPTVTRAMEALSPERREAFLARLRSLPPDRRNALVEQLVRTGTF